MFLVWWALAHSHVHKKTALRRQAQTVFLVVKSERVPPLIKLTDNIHDFHTFVICYEYNGGCNRIRLRYIKAVYSFWKPNLMWCTLCAAPLLYRLTFLFTAYRFVVGPQQKRFSNAAWSIRCTFSLSNGNMGLKKS